MSNNQTKCPKCGGYKISDFYTLEQSFLIFLGIFTGYLIKPEKEQLKCDICGYIFEVPFRPRRRGF